MYEDTLTRILSVGSGVSRGCLIRDTRLSLGLLLIVYKSLSYQCHGKTPSTSTC
jgi:hypothetical protein